MGLSSARSGAHTLRARPATVVMSASPRYGYGRPAHQRLERIIAASRETYQEHLRNCLNYQADLLLIETLQTDSRPYWANCSFTGLDAIALHYFICKAQPRLILEIGSGHSTRFMRNAIQQRNLSARVISVDPQPPAWVAALCDRLIVARLEDLDPCIFAELRDGDILFCDGSHKAEMNSDVTVFFLEVLPALPRGVLVHIHDIFWPYDYPAPWCERGYDEQYLLGCYLLAQPSRFRIEFPSAFILADKELAPSLDALWSHQAMAAVPRQGSSFWMRA